MALNNRTKTSQMMPPPGGMGMPPMGGPPMPGAPMGGPPPEPEKEKIGSPLDTLAKVLYDADVTELVEEQASSDPEKIALDIWTQYGGNELGKSDRSKVGQRIDKKDVSEEEKEKEITFTESKRWMRLPKGQTISDITTLDELANVLQGLALGTVKNMAKQNGAAGGAGGGMPPMGGPPMPAASAKTWIKISSSFDKNGLHEDADLAFEFAKNN